jgi:hypothetical protein
VPRQMELVGSPVSVWISQQNGPEGAAIRLQPRAEFSRSRSRPCSAGRGTLS